MVLQKIRTTLGRNLTNARGWRTSRKIVVLESDDWGSIRMPSKEIYNKLIKDGVRVDACPYSKFDSLESETDLDMLFNVLLSHEDFKKRHPIITTNTIVANPDFKKIKESDFTEYHYEFFTETLKHYPNHINSFNIIKQGIDLGVIFPQLHGREHLNVKRWMEYLKSSSKETRLAFDLNVFGISAHTSKEKRKSYLAAFDFDSESEIHQQKDILEDAQKIFEQLFGYKSKSFIAPNYTWSAKLEPYMKYLGINYIQGSPSQILPFGERFKKQVIRHYIGEKTQYDQIFLVRNCLFEPSHHPNEDVVSECLNQIKASFRWRKPAVISTHRLNYIGSLNESNRERGLTLLNELLTKIIKKWPNVEFMTTNELGNLITNKKSPND